jgi:hypothetical protein
MSKSKGTAAEAASPRLDYSAKVASAVEALPPWLVDGLLANPAIVSVHAPSADREQWERALSARSRGVLR